MSTEIISVIADLALTLSLVVAIIFGVAQVNAAKKDRRERLTLETLRNFQSREFAELILFTLDTEFPDNYKEWMGWPDKAQKAQFVQLMQEMESLGLLVADKFIDLNLVDKTLGSYVSNTWEKYKPMVLEMRVHGDDPFLAEYFQWLAELIDQRMKENPRRPFFEKK